MRYAVWFHFTDWKRGSPEELWTLPELQVKKRWKWASHLACPESLLIPHGITHTMMGKPPLYHKFCFLQIWKSYCFRVTPQSAFKQTDEIPSSTYPHSCSAVRNNSGHFRSFLSSPQHRCSFKMKKQNGNKCQVTRFFQTKNPESKAINNFILLWPSVSGSLVPWFPRQTVPLNQQHWKQLLLPWWHLSLQMPMELQMHLST